MARTSKKAVPENINEEYYQISTEILTSFPKYRPPVDFFRFREDILVLAPYSRKGQRLSNEQVEEVQNLCDAGSLFVSRSDHPIYSEHIVKQLDLVLQDANLKESEVADICTRALLMRYEEFAQQTVKMGFEPLYKALMVVTQWIWEDRHRVKYFVRRMFREHSAATHAFNTMAVGLWLWMDSTPGGFRRRDLDRTTLALLLHDIGMVKIPQFILAKPSALKGEERDKVLMHPLLGFKVMQRMDLAFEELARCSLEHHERMDGSGYPQRSKGDHISKLGRICAVADAFCAMIAKRSYAEAKDIEEAAKELAADRERFDPKFTAMLLTAISTNSFGELRNVPTDTLPDASEQAGPTEKAGQAGQAEQAEDGEQQELAASPTTSPA